MTFRYTLHQISETFQTGRIEALINDTHTLLVCRYYYSIYRKKWIINHHSAIQLSELYFNNQRDLLDYVSFKVEACINELKESITT
jgi:hypothetical protein